MDTNDDLPATATPDPGERRSVWRNHDYVAWLVADTSWQFGASVNAFAMTLVTYAVTGSYTTAGMVATASTVATILCTLPGGVLVDRWDRRTSLVVSGTVRALVYGAAATAWWLGLLGVPALLAVGIASGVVTGLFSTATNAAMKAVVPTADLPAAASMNQGRDAAVTLSAAPVSGLLMGASYALPFAAASLGALLQVAVTRLIRADLRPRRGPARTAGTGEPGTGEAGARQGRGTLRGAATEVFSGFHFLWANPMIRRMLPAMLLVNAGLVGLMTGLTLVFQSQGVEPWRIGLLDTTAAVGMLVGAVLSQRLVARVPTGRLAVGCFLAVIVAVVPIAVHPTMTVALVSMALSGIVITPLNGSMGGYFQALVPADIQGRVFAAFGLVGQVIPGLMPGVIGIALDHWSPGAALGSMAALLAGAGALIATNRDLRELPRPDQWGLEDSTASSAASPAGDGDAERAAGGVTTGDEGVAAAAGAGAVA